MAQASLTIKSRDTSDGKTITKTLGRVEYYGGSEMTTQKWQQLDNGCRAINGLTQNTFVDSFYIVEHSVTEELISGGA